jgi:ubiquinone/menaquinone biosynthesis C-methylase UbiE
VLDLPFADDSFDMVFSHGGLHHVPEIKQAQSEIHRVLRPGGELVIMMYARWSLNYLMSIGWCAAPFCSPLTRSPGPGS